MSKTYLVTGASGGIGAAIARTIANNIDAGTILLHYNSNATSAKQLKDEIERNNISVEIVKANLEEKEELENFVDNILSQWGGRCLSQ